MNPLVIFSLLGRLMPSYPGSLLFVLLANLLVGDDLDDAVRERLMGRQLRLDILDAGLHFNFLWSSGGFVAGWSAGTPALTIRARFSDFVSLLTRSEDPDTLFFGRKLVVEGDTELGVLLKNTIDALEPGLPERIHSLPAHLLSSVLSRMRGAGSV
ncbi:MAG: SCP2 sterol-binding domain-containing protein [Burkholderiaceae bacterium]|nr:SCP2 sterol-binding domain-containing protein [Burkholderiaceae bacterium]